MSKKRIALGLLLIFIAAAAVGGWYVTSYVPWYETPAEYEAYFYQNFKRVLDEGIEQDSWQYWQIARKGNIAMERVLRNPRATDWEYHKALDNIYVSLGHRLTAGDERAIREVMDFPERAEKDGRHELVQELKEQRLEFELSLVCYRKDKEAYTALVERIDQLMADKTISESNAIFLIFNMTLSAEHMLGKEAAEALVEKHAALIKAYGPQAIERFQKDQEYIREMRERSRTAE